MPCRRFSWTVDVSRRREPESDSLAIRPLEVAASYWHCTLEPSAHDPRQPAVRLGLELVQGFSEAAALRIVEARNAHPFGDADDLARRAQLNRGEINAPTRADALAPLKGHRRQALWSTLGLDADARRSAPITVGAAAREARADLISPTERARTSSPITRTPR